MGPLIVLTIIVAIFAVMAVKDKVAEETALFTALNNLDPYVPIVGTIRDISNDLGFQSGAQIGYILTKNGYEIYFGRLVIPVRVVDLEDEEKVKALYQYGFQFFWSEAREEIRLKYMGEELDPWARRPDWF